MDEHSSSSSSSTSSVASEDENKMNESKPMKSETTPTAHEKPFCNECNMPTDKPSTTDCLLKELTSMKKGILMIFLLTMMIVIPKI